MRAGLARVVDGDFGEVPLPKFSRGPRSENPVPILLNLDRILINGDWLPIRYESSIRGGGVYHRYDGNKGEVVLVNLDKKNPIDLPMIKEMIISAVSSYGTPEDFWRMYWDARGV